MVYSVRTLHALCVLRHGWSCLINKWYIAVRTHPTWHRVLRAVGYLFWFTRRVVKCAASYFLLLIRTLRLSARIMHSVLADRQLIFLCTEMRVSLSWFEGYEMLVQVQICYINQAWKKLPRSWKLAHWNCCMHVMCTHACFRTGKGIKITCVVASSFMMNVKACQTQNYVIFVWDAYAWFDMLKCKSIDTCLLYPAALPTWQPFSAASLCCLLAFPEPVCLETRGRSVMTTPIVWCSGKFQELCAASIASSHCSKERDYTVTY